MVGEIPGAQFANTFSVHQYRILHVCIDMVGVGAAPLNAFLAGIDGIALVVGNGEIVAGQFGDLPGFRSVVAVPWASAASQ